MGEQMKLDVEQPAREILVCSGALFSLALGNLFGVNDSDVVRVEKRTDVNGLDYVLAHVNGERRGVLLEAEYQGLLEAQELLPEEQPTSSAMCPLQSSADTEGLDVSSVVELPNGQGIRAKLKQEESQAEFATLPEKPGILWALYDATDDDTSDFAGLDARQTGHVKAVLAKSSEAFASPLANELTWETIVRAALITVARNLSVYTERRYRASMRKYMTLSGYSAISVDAVCSPFAREEYDAAEALLGRGEQ